MGLQHSTERGKRMDYEGDEYDSTRIRKDIEEDNDMIAKTLIISVKKSPATPKKKRASPKRKTSPKKRARPKKKSSPKKKK